MKGIRVRRGVFTMVASVGVWLPAGGDLAARRRSSAHLGGRATACGTVRHTWRSGPRRTPARCWRLGTRRREKSERRNSPDVALRDAINSEWAAGPRMQVAAHALGITGGHCDLSTGFTPGALGYEPGIEEGNADGPEEIRRAIRYQVKYGADLIKICATGGVISFGDSVGVQQYGEEELRAVVEYAHLVERRVAAHAHGTAGIKAAVRAGVNSIEHGTLLDDEGIRLMAERGTSPFSGGAGGAGGAGSLRPGPPGLIGRSWSRWPSNPRCHPCGPRCRKRPWPR